jgi:hypothetical protein
MNSKRSIALKNKARDILIDWVRSLVSEEEAAKITKDNYTTFLPSLSYFKAKGARRLSFFTPRWAKQRLKKLYKAGIDTKDLGVKDLQ